MVVVALLAPIEMLRAKRPARMCAPRGDHMSDSTLEALGNIIVAAMAAVTLVLLVVSVTGGPLV